MSQKLYTIQLTQEELMSALVMLRIEGFREKRDFPKSLRKNLPDGSRVIGRVMKKMRKALESQ